MREQGSFFQRFLRRGGALQLIAVLLVLVGCALLGWGFAPVRITEHQLTFSPEQMALPGASTPSVSEARRMTLSYPSTLRLGDPGWARLVFQPLVEVDPQNSVVVDPSQAVEVYVETRLELPGLWIEPSRGVGQVLPTGRSVTFWWKLQGADAGEYEGTAWLELQYETSSEGATQRQALAAPRVRVRVESLAGLNGARARGSGSIAVILGLGLFLWRWRRARSHHTGIGSGADQRLSGSRSGASRSRRD